jgi:hypothetical protein
MWTKTMAAVKVLTVFKKKHRSKMEQVLTLSQTALLPPQVRFDLAKRTTFESSDRVQEEAHKQDGTGTNPLPDGPFAPPPLSNDPRSESTSQKGQHLKVLIVFKKKHRSKMEQVLTLSVPFPLIRQP